MKVPETPSFYNSGIPGEMNICVIIKRGGQKNICGKVTNHKNGPVNPVYIHDQEFHLDTYLELDAIAN